VRGPLPDRRCSPGAIYSAATPKLVCQPGYSSEVRNVTEATKDDVYREYGLSTGPHGRTYEIDHIVSLELGGSNATANLYPEAANPRPGYHEKDRLENRLHDLVCSGELKLKGAQQAIAYNWVTLYRHVVEQPPGQ
jgi:hypothetical protein